MPDRIQFKIHGMDCAEEVAILRRELGPLVGGEQNLAFDVLQARLTVSGGGLEASAIMDAVRRTGMRAELWQGRDASAPAASRWWDAKTAVTVASGVLTVAGIATHVAMNGGVAAALGSEGLGAAETVPLIARLVYLGAVLSGAWFVLPKAWYSMRRRRPDMNLLMAIAVLGAIGIGEWFEAATVSFLFALPRR